MVFEYDDGRSQLVFVTDANGSWVTVASAIGPQEKVDANKVLNSAWLSSAPGGITSLGGLVLFQCTLYTDAIQGPELTEAIRAVAIAADEIEKELGLGDDW